MSVTFGFYNSQNGDRKYNAIQMSSIFDGIIKDGIFATVGEAMMVSEGSGMVVNVGEGRAWFDHTWTLNDSAFPVEVPFSELILNRIDTIVLDIDRRESVRANSITLVKGTPASNPVAPELVKSSDRNQYPLCHIYVGAGIGKITQANITNLVGTGDCPFVTGVLETINVDSLVAQWEAQFETWWSNLRAVLDENVAANLTARVLGLENETNALNEATEELQEKTNTLDAEIPKIYQSIADTATKWDLIWTNASQNSSFPEQILTIDGASNYDDLLIRCRYNTVYGNEQCVFIPDKAGGICYFPQFNPYLSGERSTAYSRHFAWDGDDIKISKSNDQTSNVAGDNGCIPIAIYGIKW